MDSIPQKQKFITTSIIVSLISILISVLINTQIAREYLRVDRKTQLLFGITELYRFSYQYYIAILGVIAFFLALLMIKRKPQRLQVTAALFLSLLAIIIVFARIWRLFV